MINQLIFVSSHHHLILHAWTIRLWVASVYLRRFVSFILHQYVDFASNRFTIIQSRWFFSNLLIFEIVEKSMNSKMNMRSWWNQIEMTTKNKNDLIKRKIFVTNKDLDFQINLDESKDEKSINKWINKIFYIISWIFHSF